MEYQLHAISSLFILLFLLTVTMAISETPQDFNSTQKHQQYSESSRSLWSGLSDILRNGWKSYLIDRVSTSDGDDQQQFYGPEMTLVDGDDQVMAASENKWTSDVMKTDDDGLVPESEATVDERVARYLNFNIRPATQLTGIPGKAAIVNFTTSPANTLVQGTLRLFQSTIFSEVYVQGTITGFNPGETFNIHVRQRGDVTLQCNNQGFLYNPNGITTGGFLVRSATADANGVASIDARPLGIDANLWGPFLLSVIRRSARISSGAQNSNGLTLACGTIIAAPTGPNTINAGR